ncbi:MAG: hypothetical protein EPN43_00625 [Jatrophihabitans sp.]|nr:MAG: hypothetical protein EPN43_00625 [Jatrophihabitans sp.]
MTGGPDVTGGSTGIDARTDDLRTAAHLMATAAAGVETAADACRGPVHATDPGFAGPGFEVHARVRASVAAAEALAADLGRIGHALSVTADMYDHADEGVLERLWSRFTGLVAAGLHLELAPLTFGAALLRTGDPAAAGWTVLEDNLGLVDAALNAAVASVPGLALMLDLQLTPDGHPVVRPTGRDTGGAAGRPPRNLTDVVRGLARRGDSGRHGAIDVRILTGADGTRRVIVDITGTKSLTVGTGDVADMTTNARALVGRDCSYEQGVFTALRQAGIGPADDIMLVGHSQGGMIAVDAARDAAARGYSVTHVVTVGSPVAVTVGTVPATIAVLALENRRDLVPHLDGRPNPDRRNVTTVTFDAPPGPPGTEHEVATYLRGARLVDEADDPALRSFLAGASAYFGAASVDTRTFTVRRGH